MAFSDADPVGRVLESSGLALERARLLGSRRPVLVAVSGGADSLCLLDVMVTLLEGANRRVIVGHVDHLLRPESAADAEHVQSVAAGYGLRCEVLTVDVPALAAKEGRGIEEAARLGRYRALRDLYSGAGTPTVATGHTRDDSVETVVLHLLRGAGLRGLSGISSDEVLPPDALGVEQQLGTSQQLRLIRPLLQVSRADTVRYCEARGIRWLTDESNADPRFLRNRVRGHLLPVLRTYNPAIDRALARTAELARDEDAWADGVAAARWRRIARTVDAGLGVDLPGWRRQPVPIQRRIVRLIAAAWQIDDLGHDAVERALTVGLTDGPPRAELGHGVTVVRRTATLIFDVSTRVQDE